MTSEEIASIVIQMKVPLEYKYDKLASLKWRIMKAIDLDRECLFTEFLENSTKNLKRWNQN